MREIKQGILGISTATPIFLGSCNLMRLLRMLRDLTGSAKVKMAATKPKVTISQLVKKLATKFHWLRLCIKIPALKLDLGQYCRIEPEVRKSRWWPQTGSNDILTCRREVSSEIPTATPMFQGSSIRIGPTTIL